VVRYVVDPLRDLHQFMGRPPAPLVRRRKSEDVRRPPQRLSNAEYCVVSG